VDIKLAEYNSIDSEKLFAILSKSDWPFHAGTKITRERFDKQLEKNYYNGEEIKTFFVQSDGQVVGFIRLFDLGTNFQDDDTPLFDLRLNEAFRGSGIGTEVVKQAVSYVFSNYPNKNRIEATTRADNQAKQRVLLKCGFVKEAQYRESWPTQNGELFDTLGFGMLRREWKK